MFDPSKIRTATKKNNLNLKYDIKLKNSTISGKKDNSFVNYLIDFEKNSGTISEGDSHEVMRKIMEVMENLV